MNCPVKRKKFQIKGGNDKHPARQDFGHIIGTPRSKSKLTIELTMQCGGKSHTYEFTVTKVEEDEKFLILDLNTSSKSAKKFFGTDTLLGVKYNPEKKSGEWLSPVVPLTRKEMTAGHRAWIKANSGEFETLEIMIRTENEKSKKKQLRRLKDFLCENRIVPSSYFPSEDYKKYGEWFRQKEYPFCEQLIGHEIVEIINCIEELSMLDED